MHASPGLANTWRKKLQQAVGQQCNNDSDACELLPWDREEPVFPGFGRPVETKGTLLSPEGLLDPRLGSGPFSGTAAFLARVVSIALWLLESDRSLHHALRPVYPFGLVELKEPHRGRYQKALLERLEGFQAAEQGGDAAEVLKTWLDLDEALHSLLHNPPGPASSWWGRVQRRARDTILELRERAMAAGHTVHLQLLSGRYAEVKQFTNPDSDRTTTGSVPPGDVVVCLALTLRPGRNSLPRPGSVPSSVKLEAP